MELVPHGRELGELKSMTGQYAAREEGSGVYKTLLLGEREGSTWAVNIKTKKVSNKEVICEFTGTGDFFDGDLYIPLNQTDPQLKGVLRIRFVELMAVVYTDDVENSKEMSIVCDGNGSIAGNFKKTDI